MARSNYAKQYGGNVRKIDRDEPIYRLPPWKVEQIFIATAEIQDWGLTMLNIPSLWRCTDGSNIKVAVLDTGIDFTHPDLEGSIIDSKDFTGSKAGPADLQGHGTHVAGIIAARQNSQGVVGVAPKAGLLVGKVLGDDGAGSSRTVTDGIEWAVAQKADIISMSLGSQYPDEFIHNAIKEAVKAGVFVIAAAGNDGLNHVDFPAAHEEVVAVGSIDRRRVISSFSSRGPEVDVVAPGDQILSTYPTKTYARLSGTSMATPFVAGVVALALAKHQKYGGETPIKNQQDLIEHLHMTAIDLGPKGFDEAYGFGLINPKELVKIANKKDV
jgi:subtilisin family serine protease